MPLKAPDDTINVLENLIKESKAVVQEVSMMHRMLLQAAIIDAESLLLELQGKPTFDTHEEALKVIRQEIKKVSV